MNPELLAQELESHDFDYFMDSMLDDVSDDVDKRQGSIIYDALGPAATQLAEESLQMATVVRAAYTKTAPGEFLDYRAPERGTVRQAATTAQVLAKFLDSNGAAIGNVELGDQFASVGEEPIFYHVTSVNDDQTAILTADEVGTTANGYLGQILPVTPNDALSWAEIIAVTVPAKDSETDDHLRERLLSPDAYNAYGGNVADYLDMLSKISDVGAGQVYPTWQGGGTVKLVIVNNELRAASTSLIGQVKKTIDPIEFEGQGYGLAPVGHAVTVVAPTEVQIDIESTVTTDSQATVSSVEAQIKAGIESYFAKRREAWDDVDKVTGRGYSLTVYRSQILSEIMRIEGVINATLPTLNGAESDVVMTFSGEVSELPVVGEVVLHG
ncbi:baseplate J/gp47 family protein [Levilactobacillus angrenensis]|uniref:Baseplate J/gp47 family protein n=1 Tax=Levilactobacillus angrenensis TaxID=2486020 RepID=A0ABW1UBY3_9LACO|nr:baseplate J/gp47 family protein [Levilactobacillus angrenensis]